MASFQPIGQTIHTSGNQVENNSNWDTRLLKQSRQLKTILGLILIAFRDREDETYLSYLTQ